MATSLPPALHRWILRQRVRALAASSSPSASRRRRLLLALVVVAVVVVVLASRPRPPPPPPPLALARPARVSVSLVAACRGRADGLRPALESWLDDALGLSLVAVAAAATAAAATAAHDADATTRLNGVEDGLVDAELVLVDWSSPAPLLTRTVGAAVADADRRWGETMRGPLVSRRRRRGDVVIRPVSVHVVRVEGEESWAMARAVNVGLRRASGDVVVKLDCDSLLTRGAIRENVEVLRKPSAPRAFVAGSVAPMSPPTNNNDNDNDNDRHTNGVFFAFREDLNRVRGYDERIQTYGWDDSDLYARLQDDAGLVRRPVVARSVTHLPHKPDERVVDSPVLKWHNASFPASVRKLATDAEVSNKLNQELLALVPAPRNADAAAQTEYERVLRPSSAARAEADGWFSFLRGAVAETLTKDKSRVVHSRSPLLELTSETVRAVPSSVPPPLQTLVTQDVLHEKTLFAIRATYAARYGAPFDVLAELAPDQLAIVLSRLVEKTEWMRRDAQSSAVGPARLVIVEPQGPMIDRVRITAAALAFSRASRRVLIVVWRNDAHCCKKSFHRYFGLFGEFLVLESWAFSWTALTKSFAATAFDFYEDPVGGKKKNGTSSTATATATATLTKPPTNKLGPLRFHSTTSNVVDDPSHHIYFRGEEPFKSPLVTSRDTWRLAVGLLRYDGKME